MTMMLTYPIYIQSYLIRENNLLHYFTQPFRVTYRCSRVDIRCCLDKRAYT